MADLVARLQLFILSFLCLVEVRREILVLVFFVRELRAAAVLLSLVLESSLLGLDLVELLLLQEGVVVLALWHVLRSVARVGHRVEDETELAALLARGHAVQADVELCAVCGVGVLGMGVGDAVGVGLAHVGALETALKALLL